MWWPCWPYENWPRPFLWLLHLFNLIIPLNLQWFHGLLCLWWMDGWVGEWVALVVWVGVILNFKWLPSSVQKLIPLHVHYTRIIYNFLIAWTGVCYSINDENDAISPIRHMQSNANSSILLYQFCKHAWLFCSTWMTSQMQFEKNEG